MLGPDRLAGAQGRRYPSQHAAHLHQAGRRRTTGLLYGGRVSKADPVTEACGTVDEAVAILGLAGAHTSDPEAERELLGLQRELFVVGADLATNPDERGSSSPASRS